MTNDDIISGFPSFFKLILAPRLDLHKLEIPTVFMKNYGIDLTDIVYLNIPTGKIWKVKLVKEKNTRVWLQNGWPKFVEFYSISHGYALMFRYTGSLRFNVHIFDMSASEIDYPLRTKTCKRVHKRKIRENNNNEDANMNAPTSSSHKAKGMVGPKRCKFWGNTRGATPEEIKNVESYAYQCGYPSFAVKMRPSYVQYSFVLNVPSAFFKEYTCTEAVNFILKNVTGKTWPVKANRKHEHVKIYKGWKLFAIDNNLRVGDICVFELMKKGAQNSFKVGIIRSCDVAKEEAHIKAEV
ncbi:hypothetical protein BVRB_6g138490 [Beta vulgaris subsp. vulgaris]|nr:hypothetical protein BVRB_6g138490 [Beta vulgaris subsp. vulgaris]